MKTIKDGDWNDPTVWSENRVPIDGDEIDIYHNIKLDDNHIPITVKNLGAFAGGITCNFNQTFVKI